MEQGRATRVCALMTKMRVHEPAPRAAPHEGGYRWREHAALALGLVALAIIACTLAL